MDKSLVRMVRKEVDLAIEHLVSALSMIDLEYEDSAIEDALCGPYNRMNDMFSSLCDVRQELTWIAKEIKE